MKPKCFLDPVSLVIMLVALAFALIISALAVYSSESVDTQDMKNAKADFQCVSSLKKDSNKSALQEIFINYYIAEFTKDFGEKGYLTTREFLSLKNTLQKIPECAH